MEGELEGLVVGETDGILVGAEDTGDFEGTLVGSEDEGYRDGESDGIVVLGLTLRSAPEKENTMNDQSFYQLIVKMTKKNIF